MFLDIFTSSSSYKVAYFKELAKYRTANPLFSLIKLTYRDRVGSKPRNIEKEIIATRNYREAKLRGVILVSQDW